MEIDYETNNFQKVSCLQLTRYMALLRIEIEIQY